MATRTAFEAVQSFQNVNNDLLSCVTAGRLTVPSRDRFRVDQEYSLGLNRGRAISDLRSEIGLDLKILMRFIIREARTQYGGRFRVQVSEYYYQVGLRSGQEVMAFHWTPIELEANYRTYPHLHIGSALLSNSSPISDFARLHIPTGQISLSSVIRMLIEELDVQPRRDNWRELLTIESAE